MKVSSQIDSQVPVVQSKSMMVSNGAGQSPSINNPNRLTIESPALILNNMSKVEGEYMAIFEDFLIVGASDWVKAYECEHFSDFKSYGELLCLPGKGKCSIII